MKQALRRTLARAASLLAVMSLVLALVQAGPAALAASVMTQMPGAHNVGEAGEDCAHHAAQHQAKHHHAHVALVASDVDAEHEAVDPVDRAHHHHTHPCCVSVVSIVLPGSALMRLPAPTGGHRVLGDAAERLETHAPEGPNEPPRTGYMS